jgi:CRISPR-associated endonuclease/helicase Cas3
LRVISTQLVEAGVDLDFPVVYRAISGLDSIALDAVAALEKGKVVVFSAPQFTGHIKNAIDATQHVSKHLVQARDLWPQDFERYLDRYDGTVTSLDAHNINRLLSPDEDLSVAFTSVSEKFKLIDEDSEALVVPYIVAKLTQEPNNHGLLRQLQRYTISVRRKAFEQLAAQGDIVQTGIVWVTLDARYDPEFGLLGSLDHGGNLMI